MSTQKFYADPRLSFEFSNGAIGYRPSAFDCLGPYAKVENCPVEGIDDGRRYTCYATGYADTYFSVPAATRINGKHIRGFFTLEDGAIKFVPMNGQLDKLNKQAHS